MIFHPVRTVPWTDRTLTVLRASRLEACGKELAGLGGCALFDAEATDVDAERLFSQSYYAGEDRTVRLHSIEEMRVQVLSQFPAEIGLLNQEEFTLVLKLALLGGELPLFDWNDYLPARSLVYRMWCRNRPEKGAWLHMPRQICVSALMMLSSQELRTVRDVVNEVIETADNTLYLAGMMPAETVEKDLHFRLQGSLAAEKETLYGRLVQASFDMIRTREGRRMLFHPGLYDPWSLLGPGGAFGPAGFGAGMDRESLTQLYESLMDVEDPLYDRLLGMIQGLCRQETSAEDTLEDLILLAKQGAGTEDLRSVLATRLICLPTEEMTGVLAEMRDRIPGWRKLNMERLQ